MAGFNRIREGKGYKRDWFCYMISQITDYFIWYLFFSQYTVCNFVASLLLVGILTNIFPRIIENFIEHGQGA